MTKNRTYDDAFKAAAVEKFRAAKAAGTSVTAVAKELGVSDSNLHQWAAKADGRRPVSHPRPKKKPGRKPAAATKLVKYSPKEKRRQYAVDFKQRAVAMVASGMSFAEVGRQLEVGPAQVAYWNNRGISRGGATEGREVAVRSEPAEPYNGKRLNGSANDALIYLRHAERDILEFIREGKISRPDSAHLLTLLALQSLTKALAQ